MNIILLGSTGMLGEYVFEWCVRQMIPIPVCAYPRQWGFDASNFDECEDFKQFLRNYLPPFTVINCAGAIKQKVSNRDELFAVNAEFPVKLAKFLSSIKRARMIHISSDCVFSGKSGAPYSETDLPDATDDYGASKAAGEECAKNWNCKVIRTSIIGEDKRSKVSFLEWVRSRSGGVIDGYTNHFWNGVTCLTLARAAVCLAKTFDKEDESIFHLCSQEVSKYTLASMVAEAYDLNIGVNRVEAAEAIDRRLITKNRFFSPVPLAEQIKEQKLWRLF